VGKRNSLWITLSISVGIVLFNLMIPYGRLLWHWGPFEITLGALLGGIQKAITVEGLVLLSKTFIRSDLELPGTFGRRIGESFRIFELMMEDDDRFEWKNPISSLDRILIKFSEEFPQTGITMEDPTRKKPQSGVIWPWASRWAPCGPPFYGNRLFRNLIRRTVTRARQNPSQPDRRS